MPLRGHRMKDYALGGMIHHPVIMKMIVGTYSINLIMLF
jgi:hypothetical protein